MSDRNYKELIGKGETVIGIELGSTRIKAVMTDPDGSPIASGGFDWENSQQDGIWTYPLDEVRTGLQHCYADLKKNVEKEYGIRIKTVKALGISAMMHGYLAFDAGGELLVPFRTWRNNITLEASEKLSGLFQYPVPQRWSIAHLYQAILNGEDHITKISSITTLAGYVHEKLTGSRVIGVGDASGMFPIDCGSGSYNSAMLDKFDELNAGIGPGWKIGEILPEVRSAGEDAGSLSQEGAVFLDPAGDLEAGIPLCPPEGDAGTGMVATNSVRVRTGNVSAGTSVFAMIVLEKELSKLHHEIDLITTPDGNLVAMAHSNNCSTEYSAWIELFGEAAELLGAEFSSAKLYETLINHCLGGDSDCGGLLAYGYHSGEHLTGFSEGRPLFVRKSDSRFNIANFVRTQMLSALCAMRIGLNILFEEEQVSVDEIRGHGGFFKTKGAGERLMAAAVNTPVSVMETAGEGGAWGIALLASFAVRSDRSKNLPEFLDTVFSGSMGTAVKPDPAEAEGFNRFLQRYMDGLGIERAAVESLK